MNTCYLVGAAPPAERIKPQPGDFIIAVDGGSDTLRKWGITPDFALGDFDSIQAAVPENVPCKRYPAEKDESDMELALWEGLHRGFRRFEFIGAGGGRPDHTYANLQLLVQAAELGAFAALRFPGGCTAAALVASGTLLLHGSGTVSVFAFGGDAEGVTLRGLKYPLERARLSGGAPIGLSNEIAGGEAEITLESGALLVFWETEKAAPLVNI
ncbi:MAG: thiamine diphosphokinase [Oscillospiraceae bacterium]|jgi:thiamine pyrophosphokinase|nr:thiamine diphosphokinase [Oscillospiraceae bacterium]